MQSESLFNFIAFQSLIVLFLIAALFMWMKPAFWLQAFVTYVGALTGWLSARTDEMLVMAFLLFSFGCFAGFAAGKRAWQLGIALGVWVPIFSAVANSVKATGVSISVPGILMPFVFAMV